MEELVRYIVSKILEDPNSYEITSNKESEKVTIISVKTDKENMGKVIGKNGKIANSIRAIVKSASLKSNIRYVVKIGEKESV